MDSMFYRITCIAICCIINKINGFHYPVSWKSQTHNVKSLFCQKEPINETNPVILDMNWESIIEKMDSSFLSQMDGIPRPPQTEEEIKEDSFEGYLKGEFYRIPFPYLTNQNNERMIHLDSFHEWKTKKGLLLTFEETKDIFNEISKMYNYCTLLEFIRINMIIDEVDAADYNFPDNS